MGASSAVITRRMYDETKRYVETILQAGVPIPDADYNDQMESTYTQMRRIVQNSIGDGAHGDAFKIVEFRVGGILVDNCFAITGGVTEDTGPERLFVAGHAPGLEETEPFTTGIETTPVVTGVDSVTVYDSANRYTPNALIGLNLMPNIATPALYYPIVANTDHSITIQSGLIDLRTITAANADYRVLMSTPAVDRTDLVYLDVYLDEISAEEDPSLIHVIDGIQIECMRRWKLMQAVLVIENESNPAVLSNYTDADGNRHVVTALALIHHPAGDPKIPDSIIEDLRKKLFLLNEIDDRYVNVTGDTMQGDLAFEAGKKITGDCVVDTAQICDEAVTQDKIDRSTHLLGVGDVVPAVAPVVHDNRYYRKDEVDHLIGTNLVLNSDFASDMRSWTTDTPHALYGSPQGEVYDKVLVTPKLCSNGCCGGLSIYALSGFEGCFVAAASQEVKTCSADEYFQVTTTTSVGKGDEFYTPIIVLMMYSSCQFVGTKMIRMTDEPLEAADGVVKLYKDVWLPSEVEKVIFIVAVEIVPKGGEERPPELCAVGPDDFEILFCNGQLRKYTAIEENEAVDDLCKVRDEVDIVGCDGSGVLSFIPTDHQSIIRMFRNEETELITWNCTRRTCQDYQMVMDQMVTTLECRTKCDSACQEWPIPPIPPPPPPPPYGCDQYLQRDEEHEVLAGLFSMSFKIGDATAVQWAARRPVGGMVFETPGTLSFLYRVHVHAKLVIAFTDQSGNRAVWQDTMVTRMPGDEGSVILHDTDFVLLDGSFDWSNPDDFVVGARFFGEPHPVAVTWDEFKWTPPSGIPFTIDDFDSYGSGTENFYDKWTCNVPIPGPGSVDEQYLSTAIKYEGTGCVGLRISTFGLPAWCIWKDYDPLLNLSGGTGISFAIHSRTGNFLRFIITDNVGGTTFSDLSIPISSGDGTNILDWTVWTIPWANFLDISAVDLTNILTFEFQIMGPSAHDPVLFIDDIRLDLGGSSTQLDNCDVMDFICEECSIGPIGDRCELLKPGDVGYIPPLPGWPMVNLMGNLNANFINMAKAIMIANLPVAWPANLPGTISIFLTADIVGFGLPCTVTFNTANGDSVHYDINVNTTGPVEYVIDPVDFVGFNATGDITGEDILWNTITGITVNFGEAVGVGAGFNPGFFGILANGVGLPAGLIGFDGFTDSADMYTVWNNIWWPPGPPALDPPEPPAGPIPPACWDQILKHPQDVGNPTGPGNLITRTGIFHNVSQYSLAYSGIVHVIPTGGLSVDIQAEIGTVLDNPMVTVYDNAMHTAVGHLEIQTPVLGAYPAMRSPTYSTVMGVPIIGAGVDLTVAGWNNTAFTIRGIFDFTTATLDPMFDCTNIVAFAFNTGERSPGIVALTNYLVHGGVTFKTIPIQTYNIDGSLYAYTLDNFLCTDTTWMTRFTVAGTYSEYNVGTPISNECVPLIQAPYGRSNWVNFVLYHDNALMLDLITNEIVMPPGVVKAMGITGELARTIAMVSRDLAGAVAPVTDISFQIRSVHDVTVRGTFGLNGVRNDLGCAVFERDIVGSALWQTITIPVHDIVGLDTFDFASMERLVLGFSGMTDVQYDLAIADIEFDGVSVDNFNYLTVIDLRNVWASYTFDYEKFDWYDAVLVKNDYRSRFDPYVGECGMGDSVTGAKYGSVAYRNAKPAGCRRIWLEYVYADKKECLGLPVAKQSYEFYIPGCICVPNPFSLDISDLVSDPAMFKILPDDAFDGLPSDEPEAIWFEYCHPQGRVWKRFGSQSPSPDGTVFFAGGGRYDPNIPSDLDYWVKVYMGPSCMAGRSDREVGLTVDAILSDDMQYDFHVIPDGTRGFAVGFPVWVRNCCWPGNERRPINCCEIDGGEDAGIGTVRLFVEDPRGGDRGPGLQYMEFVSLAGASAVTASRDVSGFNWGAANFTTLMRFRFQCPIDTTLVVKLYDVNGKIATKTEAFTGAAPWQNVDILKVAFTLQAGYSWTDTKRFEITVSGMPLLPTQRVFMDDLTLDPSLATVQVIDDFEGYADTTALLAVWTAYGVATNEIAGVYGTVIAYDPVANTITVRFNAPTTGRFLVASRAEIIVSPPFAKGFYWEASPGLIDLAEQLEEQDPGHGRLFMRWGFRFWQSTLSTCSRDPIQPPATFIADSDGITKVWQLHGDLEREVINPVEWRNLWCSPVLEYGLLANVVPGSRYIRVCSPEMFHPCDVIGIIDDATPGLMYYNTVCNVYYTIGLIEVKDEIPGVFRGWPAFDMWDASNRHAVVFVHSTQDHMMKSPTLIVFPDGTPIEGTDFVGVDYAEGVFHFNPLTDSNQVKVCFSALHDTIQLPCIAGWYRFAAVDGTGCVGALTDPVEVIVEQEEQN